MTKSPIPQPPPIYTNSIFQNIFFQITKGWRFFHIQSIYIDRIIKMQNNIIEDIRRFLIEEKLYTPKDELNLILLENTYNQYIKCYNDVKKNGNTLIIKTYYGGQTEKKVPNPAFNNMLALQKELFKLLDSLYLTPKSRQETKDKNKTDDNNPFAKMMAEIEKR